MKARNRYAIHPLMSRCVRHGKTVKAQRAHDKRRVRRLVFKQDEE